MKWSLLYSQKVVHLPVFLIRTEDTFLSKVWLIFFILKRKALPIGQRPIALQDSSKSINIKSISTAATIYLMPTALQNCKINCLYSVLP